MSIVTVYLDKITDLRNADTYSKSDPYVVFNLEQDNYLLDKNYGKKISSKKKDDLNPEYGETFEFTGVPTLKNLVLRVRVMDDDIGFDQVLGTCVINLEKLKKDSDPMTVETVIEDKAGVGFFDKKAKIFLKIKYTSE
jgi:Ca2+-dependent lipid-binding protein